LPRFPDHIGAALVWRYACHAAMLALTLTTEGRPAPTLPDTILSVVPRIDWVAQNNYLLWLGAYVPVGLLLWYRDRALFLRFLWVGGFLSLARGLCVPLTGLGPVAGGDPNAGIASAAALAAWWDLVNPLSALDGAAHIHLTKDLFFSGHTASTFLLFLYCRRDPRLGPVALVAHALTVAVVLLAHLHYSIDVVGAWAITFTLYSVAERHLRVGSPPTGG